MIGVEQFFAYARERYRIMMRRAENPADGPWTEDPILQQYRFCNVFREDDATTQWFRMNVRSLNAPEVLWQTILFRWFNRIDVGEQLKHWDLFSYDNWHPSTLRKALEGWQPITTGAYMTKTPPGMKKLEGIIWCMQQVAEQWRPLVHECESWTSLQEAHTRLMKFPYLGSFMAYEVVTDLRHTWVLRGASDTNTWAAAGPGAARGLQRVLGGDLLNYVSKRDQEKLLLGMRVLLVESEDDRLWPSHSSGWPRWEMRDVEHTLCEFDKYERTRLREGRPKQLFRGGQTCE